VRRAVLLLCVLAAAALGGCGSAAEVRERDLVSNGPASDAASRSAPRRQADDDTVRIAIVTHGQAASDFWAIVKNGSDAAARQMGVTVTYRSPDVYSVARMRQFIDEAIASRPDGLVVSIPTPALAGAIRRAVRAGIPVVSINSGSDIFRRLGVLAHVGQEEGPAGLAAGKRMASEGVRHALCVNHEPGNEGPDSRCRGFSRAIRAAGGTSRVVPIDLRDAARGQRQIADALRDKGVDGMLTLSSDGGEAALRALAATGRAADVELGTFDLSPEVLRAVLAGRMRFAIDQQAYLQGYLPVVMLGELARYGLFAAEGRVIPTGPHFVTRATAAQAIRLSQRGIR
jgi:simple sugar transport system substrate-binding protein